MAQTQLIKRRIRSVSNTRQITKAMQLVAASKMRRAQEATLRTRAYSSSAQEILGHLAKLAAAKQHPLFAQRPVQTQLLILVASDRGLAGAYNSNLLRAFTSYLQDHRDISSQAIAIGAKGARFVNRLQQVELIGAYTDWPTQPTSTDIRPISESAIKAFAAKKIDSVQTIYTKFISTIRQEVIIEQLLPIKPRRMSDTDEVEARHIAQAIFEPSPQTVLAAIVPRLVETQLFQTILEAVASEQSMRMMAMKNATDNANELMEDLTLAYNSARQASITQELAEISAGAEAIT